MAKPILFSGIQPTGRLHIGNYLGALKNFVDLQNSEKYDCYFCIVDLHSLTGELDPKEKPKQILDLAADYLAAGLDPKKSIIFQQSQVSAHSELMWILNTITPMGELERMTQFKSKGDIKTRISEILSKFGNPQTKVWEQIKDNDGSLEMEGKNFHFDFIDKNNKTISHPVISGFFKLLIDEVSSRNYTNVGLFDYPVLMAADILLYDTHTVPVGDDQLQHLELARTLARKFNSRFGKTFIEPKGLLTKTPRVMSLKDPLKKMSKSVPEGCLFLDDSPKEIATKITRAVTDSGLEIEYDPEKKPGLSNLLEIYCALSHTEIKLVTKEFSGQQYSVLKKRLAELVSEHFADFREKKKFLLAKPDHLKEILETGSGQAGEVAAKKIVEVKKKIGVAID